jgi:isoleucyl-tRNA synthetase
VTVLLDTKLTPELVQEGLARELINRIQRLRKDSGLQVSDRISLKIKAESTLAVAARSHADYIKRETLATELDVSSCESAELAGLEVTEIEGNSCSLALSVVKS